MNLKKPKKSSYPAYFGKYVSKCGSGDIYDQLASQEKEFKGLMKTVSAKDLDYRYAEGKWSLRESLVHMVDTEQIFCYRALCISRGEKRKLPGFDQDKYIQNANLEHITKKQIIDNFVATRKASIHLFKSLCNSDWERSGKVSDYEIGLTSFPYIVVGHTEHHFRILKKKYKK